MNYVEREETNATQQKIKKHRAYLQPESLSDSGKSVKDNLNLYIGLVL